MSDQRSRGRLGGWRGLGALAALPLAAAAHAAQDGAAQEAAAPFPDEPEAHALYDRMVESMRAARTLSWVADYRWETPEMELGHATYRIWLAKPNQVRLEATPAATGKVSGVLVGDGEHFFTYWPEGKPRYQWEYREPWATDWEKNRLVYYMKKRTPVGQHSIAHETDKLGAGMTMTILDPSTFHGYTDSMQPYLDGVRSLGEREREGEVLDGIEVSLMEHQRSWELWLSRRDHLPRELVETIRVAYDIVKREAWSEVTVDAPIADETFAWTPPEGWVQWEMPPIEAGLLAKGTPAPDFELTSLDGGKVRLSQFRGRWVWMFKWRVG